MQRQNSQITMEVDEANDENAKKIGDNIVPSLIAEPLLKSITTNAVVKEEKGMQIRSSARVSKKMKLEQEQDKKVGSMNAQIDLILLDTFVAIYRMVFTKF